MNRHAKTIVGKYIAESAEAQINIDSSTRKDILFKLESDTVNATLFEEAQQHVVMLISSDSLPKFSTSPVWLDYEKYGCEAKSIGTA